jgi:hypothetical protein
MVDVVLGYVAFVPSLLHQNHIGVISNFKMEPVRAKNKALV